MNTTTIPLLLAATLGCASAHVSYTNRDLGTFSPGNETKSATKSGTISSTFGWAYSTDDDLGDSHRNRAFRFMLLNPGEVVISVQRTGAGNILLPALSVYSGLTHLPPEALAHDSSALSLTYLASLGGTQPKQGAFNALGDWSIGNDDIYNIPGDSDSGVAVPASLRSLVYQGNAADGTSANFGSAAGINGDGLADSFVTGSFNLPAGDFTIMVGGAEYLTTPSPYTSYAADVTLSVIPEPSAALLGALGAVALLRRRR
ncbi:MAG: hypothetical protein ACO3JG_00210 [Luteolibacter sp.]